MKTGLHGIEVTDWLPSSNSSITISCIYSTANPDTDTAWDLVLLENNLAFIYDLNILHAGKEVSCNISS